MKTLTWHVIGASVRGASHIRHNIPNQDAIAWYPVRSKSRSERSDVLPDSGSGLPIILAIADGHGSQKSFRSETGADLAVSIAIETVQDFLEHQPAANNFTQIKRIAEEQLPQELVRRWNEAVADHLKQKPFSEEEKKMLNRKNEALAYGATILITLVTDTFTICWQLGDGDILTVWNDGNVERPMPKDERLFANETTSLCAKNAWRDFRFWFQPIVTAPPKLILAATDGYANSFRDDESFLKVGSDIWEMIQTEGLNVVKQQLETWLNEASEAGSGDDITVGIICRVEQEVE